MSTANEVFINGERLDLDAETALLPTLQANDRSKPSSIQSDFSPEFTCPGSARNHRILGQAALSSATKGVPYRRLPAVLTSGGVDIMPLGSLLIKGFTDGRYQLQLVGGNRRLVDAMGEKTLADLKLDRFNHAWNPTNIALNLPYAKWLANGWGYEPYDRGKPVDFAALDPYSLYPSTSGRLLWQQLLTDTGFTADDLSEDDLFAALNVPTSKPYGYGDDYREARHLSAGIVFDPSTLFYYEEFDIVGPYRYTANAPWVRGADVAVHDQGGYQYVVPVLGYYKLTAELGVQFGCSPTLPGRVRMGLHLRINGQEFTYPDENGNPVYPHAANGEKVHRGDGPDATLDTLSATCPRILLKPGDVVDTRIFGQDIPTAGVGPFQAFWRLLNNRGGGGNQNADGTIPGAKFEVELLPDFPEGGTIRLQDWLPKIKLIDYFKTVVALLGLSVQTDAYRNHLYLTTGGDVLRNVGRAPDWTALRDAYAPAAAAVPERSLAFRFGEYAQRNQLVWTEDDQASEEGIGDGEILVDDEVLPTEPYEMVKLPFSASENSLKRPGLLLIANYKANGIVAPVTYSEVDAKPRLTLRRQAPPIPVQLITTPATETKPAVTMAVTTTASYFLDGLEPVDLDLQRTVLAQYWPDLRALLKEARNVVERYRLSPLQVASLRFSQPIFDEALGGYFIISKISEYDSRRSVSVEMARLHPTLLPAPGLLEDGREFYGKEFEAMLPEFY